MHCITNYSLEHQLFIYTHLNGKIVVFLTIQLSISALFSSIWPKDRNLSGASTPSQSELRCDGNEWVLVILQISSITEASLSDCLESYPGNLVGGWVLVAVLPLCQDAVSVFYCLNRLDHTEKMLSVNVQWMLFPRRFDVLLKTISCFGVVIFVSSFLWSIQLENCSAIDIRNILKLNLNNSSALKKKSILFKFCKLRILFIVYVQLVVWCYFSLN